MKREAEQTKTAVLPPPAEEKQMSLFSAEALRAIRTDAARWRREVHDPLVAKRGPWKKDFTTVSSMVNPLATPGVAGSTSIAPRPGRVPVIRGIRSDRLPRKAFDDASLAGFGTPKQTNEASKSPARPDRTRRLSSVDACTATTPNSLSQRRRRQWRGGDTLV
jgi:hypothetical protein